jgi:hypothetical protein
MSSQSKRVSTPGNPRSLGFVEAQKRWAFEGTASSVQVVLNNLKQEEQLSTFAGSRGLKELGLGLLLGLT